MMTLLRNAGRAERDGTHGRCNAALYFAAALALATMSAGVA